MANISFYGSHNGSIVVEDKGEILCVIETERITGVKNSGICQYKTYRHPWTLVDFILDWIEKTYGIKEFDNCIANCSVIHHNGVSTNLAKKINAKNFIYPNHHESHANGAFYQSPYESALIFSFDGGGDDGKFNIYLANREQGPMLVNKVKNPILGNDHIYYDLGFPYATFGDFFDDITQIPLTDGNLIYPGKIMGLCAFGEVHEDWIPYFMDYYKANAASGEYEEEINKIIGDNIGVKFDRNNRLKGQIAYDIAATSQKAFEECFLEVALPYMEKYQDMPIILTGGCALNIILNTRIKTEFNKEVFIGPNPNDCGLGVGLLLSYLKPKTPIDITYKGIPILDLGTLLEYLNTHDVNELNIEQLVQNLKDGKIIGVIRDQSEHGPRALGNRSIICDPSIPNMKDILNAKVKNREWYRPFAPVVRLEDVSKYFEWEGESRWMNFCPMVKEEWKEKLPSITHIDGTARIQTVTKEQNSFLYELLSELDKQTGVGVLLNTSFNVAGKPILSTIKDGFLILQTTELDGLIIENHYITQ